MSSAFCSGVLGFRVERVGGIQVKVPGFRVTSRRTLRCSILAFMVRMRLLCRILPQGSVRLLYVTIRLRVVRTVVIAKYAPINLCVFLRPLAQGGGFD